jgi:hypothetical protein
VSRGTWELIPGRQIGFNLQDYHLLWSVFPDRSTNRLLGNSPTGPNSRQNEPRNPACTTRSGFNVQDGLGSFPFARRY